MNEVCRSPAVAEAMAGKEEQARGRRSACRATIRRRREVRLISFFVDFVCFVVDLETADLMFLPNEPIFLPNLSGSRRFIPGLPAIAASAVAAAAMADEAAMAGQSQSNRCRWPDRPQSECKYFKINDL